MFRQTPKWIFAALLLDAGTRVKGVPAMKISAVKTFLLCLLLPALMLVVRPIAAQTTEMPFVPYFITGVWDCPPEGGTCISNVHCPSRSTLPPGTSVSDTVIGFGPPPTCPGMWSDVETCEQQLNITQAPLCCVGYGYADNDDACVAAYRSGLPPGPPSAPDPAPQPDPTPDPTPQPDPTPDPTPSQPDPGPTPDPAPQPDPTPEAPAPAPQPAPTSSGGGGGGGGGALLAGGAVIALFAFANYLTPSPEAVGWWPQDLHVRPRAHLTSRDGVSGASANITANYGNWRARMWSRNAGRGWSSPGVSAHWSALSGDSWNVNAQVYHPGGQWARPYARVEWVWEF